ncbi:hypothetical protein [Pantoea sp. Sc1]|uniref:hypothetical protein n=1 Tax=Pantoea sp. Sc1 TaxID=593105 RepID=UPI001ED97F8F|nr:hypothetical protein [Pantoea sp. Sc1]
MAFQNPAQNFAEQRLNLGDLVTLSPHSTFLVRSDSSYPEAGIMQGSASGSYGTTILICEGCNSSPVPEADIPIALAMKDL